MQRIMTYAYGLDLAQVKSMDDCHASIVHSRGKKKASVEVEKLKIGWKASGAGRLGACVRARGGGPSSIQLRHLLEHV